MVKLDRNTICPIFTRVENITDLAVFSNLVIVCFIRFGITQKFAPRQKSRSDCAKESCNGKGLLS